MKKANRFSCFAVNRGVAHVFTLFSMLLFAGTLTAQTPRTQVRTPGVVPKDCNKIMIGFSGILEDSYDPFITIGPNITYMHPISGMFGITGDAGVNFGSGNDVKYTKFQLLAGPSLLPGKRNKISFSPHLLAGVAYIRSKYEFNMTDYSMGNTAFSLAAGTDVSFPVKNGKAITVRADYNPSFVSGGATNNIRVGLGFSLAQGCPKTPATVYADGGSDPRDSMPATCVASKDVREVKFTFTVIEEMARSFEKICNTIPRVEAKVFLRPEMVVKQGEECCKLDKIPVSYTELKAGIEGGAEINFNLWGIPDIHYSLKLWPVLLITDFKCKLFTGPTGKINVDGVGKFYGNLGERNPSGCRSCVYFNIKEEGFFRIGVKAGGSVNLYHWSPLSPGEAGFDVTGEPDESLEVSAEASASIGNVYNGTWAGIGECTTPAPGLHGSVKIGKAKANLRFTIRLGPISFDPSFEHVFFDGWEFSF